MKAWLQGPSGLEPIEQDPMDLAPDELRVEVEAVCLQPRDLARAKEVAPGGGVVGRVVECGEAASAYDGARVLVAPTGGCGECDTCRRGAATVCPTRSILGESIHGGCAESVVAKARWVTRLDTGLEVDSGIAALLAGPALAAYGLYARAGVSAGQLVIVLGAGPTAAILSTLAKSRGVTVVSALGANADSSIAEQLSTVDAKGRPQTIFVCDGDESMATALRVANPGSTLVAMQGAGPVDLSAIAGADLSLLGFSYGHPDLMTETAALVVKGELDLSPFATEQVLSAGAAKSAQEAFEEGKCLLLRHGESA